MSGEKFIIDANTREIEVPSSELIVAQGDHNSERFLFECPRIVDGNDLSKCVARVHYLTIDASGNQQEKGAYTVEDLTADDEKIKFSWLLTANSTKLKGILSFRVSFTKTEDTSIVYSWSTGIVSVIKIIEGYVHTDDVLELYPDVIEGMIEETKKRISEEDDTYPIQYIESLDEENMVNLRDLESGLYILYGYFKPFPNSSSTLIVDTGYYMVTRLDEGSHLLNISPLNFKLNCHEILVDETAEHGFTYENKRINLLDVYNMLDENRVSQLPEITEANEEQFLQVVNGYPTWVTVGSAEEGDF